MKAALSVKAWVVPSIASLLQIIVLGYALSINYCIGGVLKAHTCTSPKFTFVHSTAVHIMYGHLDKLRGVMSAQMSSSLENC